MERFESDHLTEMTRRARQLVDEYIIPLERLFLLGQSEELAASIEELRGLAKDLDLWAPSMPAAIGGTGMTLIEYAHVSEQLGRSPLGHFVCNAQAPDIGNMELLLNHGTQEQKTRWLKPLVAGDIRSAFSMTEPANAGSNPTLLSTNAFRDGDHYVINGDKWFTTGADGAAFTIVMAVTDREADTYRKATQIIVPLESDGVSVVRNIPLMGETRSGWESHSELTFSDCRVPLANRIGSEGEGFKLAQARLGPGRIHHAMRWIGICERSIELMCQFALGRELTTGQTVADRQVVQHWIADSRAETDAARLMVLRTAETLGRKGQKGARTEISLIKFFVAGVLQRVIDRAIQVHGGLGMTDYTPLSYWYRLERGARLYDGPDEVHRDLVARSELNRHR